MALRKLMSNEYVQEKDVVQESISSSETSSSRSLFSRNEGWVEPGSVETKPKVKEGVVSGTLKALGSGTMLGAEGLLETEQNAANLLGKLLSGVSGKEVEVSQMYRNKAVEIEQARQQLFPDGTVSGSIPGKIVSGLAQTPAMITQIAGLGGGVKGFAALGALGGVDDGVAAMAGGAAKGAVMGAILGKAEKFGLVPRTTTGAGVGAADSVFSGQDSDDIVANMALMGGFAAASNPRMMKEIMEVPAGAVKGVQTAYKNISKIPATVKSVGDAYKTFRGEMKSGAEAIMDKPTIEKEIQYLINDKERVGKFERYDIMREQEAIVEQMKLEKSQFDAKVDMMDNQNKVGIGTIEASAKTQKNILDNQKSRLQYEKDLELDRAKLTAAQGNQRINGLIDKMNKGVADTSENISKNLKNGVIQNLWKQFSSAYDASANRLFDTIDAKSPVKGEMLVDMLAKVRADIIDKGATSDSVVLNEINLAIEKGKSGKLGVSETAVPKGMQSNRGALEAVERAQAKSATVPFKEIRREVKRILDKADYGSFEADMLRHSFTELSRDMLRGSGKSTSAWEDLQSSMSDIISYKTIISREFGIKGGKADWIKAAKSLSGLAEEGGTPAERLSNRRIQQYMSFLEKGAKVGETDVPGIGDISGRMKTLGTRLQKLKSHLEQNKQMESVRMVEIAETFKNKIAALDAKGEMDSLARDKAIAEYADNTMRAMAEVEMKYTLAQKALGSELAGKKAIVQKGEDFVIQTDKTISSKKELLRQKQELIDKRNETLGVAHALFNTLPVIAGMWKVARAGKGMVDLTRHAPNMMRK